MKKLFLLLGLLSILSPAFTQIGGISGSKLQSYCVDVVDHHKQEFEPSFSISKTNGYWDNDGVKTDMFPNSNQYLLNTGMQFRFTYGLWDKLEMGVSMASDLQSSDWGMRYIIQQKKNWGVALIAGMKIPLGNRIVDPNSTKIEDVGNFGFGLVGSYTFSDRLSLDVTTQAGLYNKKLIPAHYGNYFFNTDLGYYIFNKQLQLIGGFGYQGMYFEGEDRQLFTFYPGFTAETGDHFLFVMGVPISLHGKNIENLLGFNFALTITLD
ncbi:MAG: hypothetical protein JEZ03_03025 [Bacteroidales bacterium]|nr:hypothetical protein [Bacteroidales bacterium]